MSTQELHLYEFGPYRLDADQRLLFRNNELVPLTPKVIDTLIALMEGDGRVMGKGELMQKLWPDSFVEESSLSQNIFLLRKALGEGLNEFQYIETVPKRGYRFVAQVRQVSNVKSNGTHGRPEAESFQKREETNARSVLAVSESQANPESPATKQRIRLNRPVILGAFILIAVTGSVLFFWNRLAAKPAGTFAPQSIAVLPFKTVGAEESELLGMGMTDSIIMKLSSLKGIKVLPTSVVIKYSKQDVDSISVGKQLGVDAVLEGTVQKSKGIIRVSVRLIETREGKTLWTEKFDEPLFNIFALQDTIANELTKTVSAKLTEDERARLGRRHTQNMAAYQDYLNGIYFWNKRNKDSLAKAIHYFQQAIQKDNSFALAYALLADCYGLNLYYSYEIVPLEEAIKLRDEAARKALELDENLAEAHLAIVPLKVREKDYIGARREFEHAIRLSPNNPTVHIRYAFYLFQSTRLRAGLAEAKIAQSLDPVSPTINSVLCSLLMYNRQPDEALKFCEKSLELEPDANHIVRETLGFAYMHNGLYDRALEQFRMMKDQQPVRSSIASAQAYAASGRRAEAQQILSEVLQNPENARNNEYRIAKVYLVMGNKAKAIEWLDKLALVSTELSWLKYDPQLDELRSTPEFENFIRRRGIEHMLKTPSW